MPEVLPLWPDEAALTEIDLTVSFTPSERPRGAVMVCPGGGYAHLADHEKADVVAAFNQAGFDAAALRYRVGSFHRHPDMIHDACRGMRLFRQALEHADRPAGCAVLGFSAGGHLAATLSVHPDRFPSDADDLRGRYAARPDAAVLCYPVISFANEIAHEGCRRNLLGEAPDPILLDRLSLNREVHAEVPPTFLWHTVEDEPVPVAHSMRYAQACVASGVPVELHCFEQGRHGLGLALEYPAVATWFGLATAFLERHLTPKESTA